MLKVVFFEGGKVQVRNFGKRMKNFCEISKITWLYMVLLLLFLLKILLNNIKVFYYGDYQEKLSDLELRIGVFQIELL